MIEHHGLRVRELLWGVNGETVSLAGAQPCGDTGSSQRTKQWSGEKPGWIKR